MEAGLTISETADLANALVAFLALGLSILTLLNQKRKDRESAKKTEELRSLTIRLEWYKDFVIAENKVHLETFYKALETLSDHITSSDLTPETKKELNEKVKSALIGVRKTLIDSILPINTNLHDEVRNGIDDLVGKITLALSDDTLKLSHPDVFEKEIGQPIRDSRKNILTLLYGYRGD